MTEQKTRRVLRMHGIKGDGTPNTAPLTLVVKDPYTGDDILEDDGSPAVTITLRPISDDERREIVAARTSLQRLPDGGRGLGELTDHRAVTDDVLRTSIQSWSGIAGADDRPLVCTDATKVMLAEGLKAQITRKLFGVEAVEVAAESFR